MIRKKNVKVILFALFVVVVIQYLNLTLTEAVATIVYLGLLYRNGISDDNTPSKG